MNNEVFLNHLEAINPPIESIKKIREALNHLRELGFVDDAILTHIKRDELHAKNLPIGSLESYSILDGIKPIYAVAGATVFLVGLPTFALTGSWLISSVLTAGVYYSAFKMRCKWMKDRIEVLTERRKFKSEIQRIAIGIKYIDSLEITYRKGQIKQGIFKILETTESITAGELLVLVDDLESAFIQNEEIGFLREQAFDEMYVPEEYRTPEETKLSKLDFLTVNNEKDSVRDDADAIEAHFEQLIDRPFKAKDVDEVRLSKTLHESRKDRDNPLVDNKPKHKESISLAKESNDHLANSGVVAAVATVAASAAITSVVDDESLNDDDSIPAVEEQSNESNILTDDKSSDSSTSFVDAALAIGEMGDGDSAQSLSELLSSQETSGSSDEDSEGIPGNLTSESVEHFDFEVTPISEEDESEIDDFNSVLDDGIPDLDFDTGSLDMPDINASDDDSLSMSDLDSLLGDLEDVD